MGLRPHWCSCWALSLLGFLLLMSSQFHESEAFGAVEADVNRPDGLCACLVWPVKGYSCREYMVQTDDQFLIGVQRVSKQGYRGKPKGPVLLLHGVLLGGDVWVLNPPEQSIAFLLADEGYDVWIGNTRTTRFSYGHVLYTKKDKGFWDWSVDELAQYDLPAMMGLIKGQTNNKVHFIGYSQGSQQAFAALSQGELLDVVNKVVFLAPVAFVNDLSAPLSKLASTFYIDRIYESLHDYEFSTQLSGSVYSRKKEIVDIICREAAARCFRTWISLFTGNNCCLNTSRRAIIDTYETQSTATKNLRHFAQQYRQKTFAKFDYGFWGNLVRYLWPRPPTYDLSKVPTSNTFFVHGGGDSLSDPKDVALLFSLLPNDGSYLVKFIPEYAHIDFILGSNAKDLVYNQVMDFLAS